MAHGSRSRIVVCRFQGAGFRAHGSAIIVENKVFRGACHPSGFRMQGASSFAYQDCHSTGFEAALAGAR